ncbi:MAG: hypothetical protein AMJ91_06905 [candidate division Zixibacteria bacterium SM23_73_3]|nr:MAG: hypothetical protein AMJ91_06905 [candidate division Zixibacteria bacterium SM23_73_3]
MKRINVAEDFSLPLWKPKIKLRDYFESNVWAYLRVRPNLRATAEHRPYSDKNQSISYDPLLYVGLENGCPI